jgi:hypothetical protein
MARTGVKILLTNTYLLERAGTELYIRDIATTLLRLGQQPIVYSPRLGAVAAEIRAATIPVVDTLDALGEPPDLIHGQHHLETMTALLRFPDVPAVFFSHGWQPWQEAPPRFPRILHYVAVDYTVRDRLVYEHGIAPEQVSTILNFVDLDRFRPRASLPARPRRALLFGNFASADYRSAVTTACAQHDIVLETVGRDTGAVTTQPEALLPQYDLVFAKARAAIEAMATGAAVILASPDGVGPLVTSANFDQLRRFNFGIRTLGRPCTAEYLSAEIARYDPADAQAVGARIRQTAGLGVAVEQIVAVYERVVAAWGAARRDPAAESRAVSDYLRWFSRSYPEGLVADLQQVEAARQALLRQIDGYQATVATLTAERDALRQESAALRQENTALRDAAPQAQAALAAAQHDDQAALAQLQAQVVAMRTEIQAMRRTRGWRALEQWWRLKRRFFTRPHRAT